VTLDLDKNCEICHAPQNNTWIANLFNHNETNFALLGMHAEADCAACHSGPAPTASRRCESCHIGDYNTSLEPAHLEQGYPTDCRDCHDSFTWNSNFNHDNEYILREAHLELMCNECHMDRVFDDTPQACGTCHLPAWEASENPPHDDAEFDRVCENCHGENDWVPSNWDHNTETEYLLDGEHLKASCESCHEIIPYSDQPTECYACHQADYEATLEPNHITIGLPTTCEVCHTTTDWTSDGIDHNQTQFPLQGAHAELLCETCHVDGYDLPIICEGCHLPDYEGTNTGQSPDHQQYGFTQDCLQCHDQVAWIPSSFDHDPNITGYPLEGSHQDLLPNDCFACHEDAQWSGISSDCEDCHQSAYSNTTEPDHASNGFPENLCES